MPKFFKKTFAIAKDTVSEFIDDRCARMAAALAYYTIFSLPPLLVIVIKICGVVWDPSDVQGEIAAQMKSVVGAEGADAIRNMIASAGQSGRGVVATTVGVVALVFGASGVVVQLQDALNAAWQVAPDPDRGGLINFITKRLLSFAMILVVAFLLLSSLVLSAMLAAVGERIGRFAPEGVSHYALMAGHAAVSFLVITMLFAAMFKFLPDAKIAWKDVAAGAVFTAVLFVLGKYALGLYLGNMDMSKFGQAASLMLVLVWIYYTSVIMFLGAQFTQVWVRHRGKQIVPTKHAVRVVKSTETVRPGDDASEELKEPKTDADVE